MKRSRDHRSARRLRPERAAVRGLLVAFGLLVMSGHFGGGTHVLAAEESAVDPADPDWAEAAARAQFQTRDGLYGSPEYNWYDEESDTVRPIDLRMPEEPEPARSDWDENGRSGGGMTAFSQFVFALAWLLLAVVLVAIVYVALVFYLQRSKRRARRQQLGGAADAHRRIEALPLAGRRKDLPLLAAARKFYEDGNYAEAVIYLFSYQLLELDKNHHIHLAKGKTNRQYHEELAARRPLQVLYQQTMLVFEDSYFGDHPPTRARFESCWNRLDQFERLVRKETA